MTKKCGCHYSAAGIILIVIGTLLFLDQLGVVGFGKTWPAILIAIGCIKIFGKKTEDKKEE